MDLETIVAVVATRPETVLADYRRLLDLAGIDRGPSEVCLVPAPPGAEDGPAEACPPWQLEGVMRALLDAGHDPIDLSLVPPPAAGAASSAVAGWRRIAETYDVPHATAAAGSCLLLASLRTDGRLGLLGASAALAARIDGGEQVAAAVDAWPRAEAQPLGAVVDATVCGDALHASVTVPVAAHVLLAGRDPVAVDAVACRLVGLDPRRVPLLAALAAAGLGRIAKDDITLEGDTAALAEPLALAAAQRFRPAGDRDGGPRWWRRWRDGLAARWPRPLPRRRARNRYRTQPWGRLHQEYDRRGTIGGGPR